jgi:hypothetical protein
MLKLDTIWARRRTISEDRLKICNLCEFFNKESSRCNKCGCFMDYKTLLPYVECPIGKWNEINKEESKDEENT